MVLSATHRYRKKYVTTLLYKPIWDPHQLTILSPVSQHEAMIASSCLLSLQESFVSQNSFDVVWSLFDWHNTCAISRNRYVVRLPTSGFDGIYSIPNFLKMKFFAVCFFLMSWKKKNVLFFFVFNLASATWNTEDMTILRQNMRSFCCSYQALHVLFIICHLLCYLFIIVKLPWNQKPVLVQRLRFQASPVWFQIFHHAIAYASNEGISCSLCKVFDSLVLYSLCSIMIMH